MMDSQKTLFIGNSYTYCNKMPWMVSKLAESSGKTLEVEMITQGGVSFEWHFNNPETLAAIGKTGWDFVVLQNHSLGAVKHKEKMQEYGLALLREAQKHDAPAILYMTWARQHISEMQEEITEAYTSLARQTGAVVAPVGIAWENALEANPELILHTKDKSHPNPAGSYLTACVFYATFYPLNPEGLTGKITIDGEDVIDLDDKESLFLQSMAWKAVQEFEL